MNILYINHYAGGPAYGMEYRPYYLSREWVNHGHNVLMLAASYSHIRANQPKVTNKMLNESSDGIHFRWYRTPEYSGNGLGRVRNMLSFIWSLYRDKKDIVGDFKPDVVIASSTYPMDIWPARSIAKKTGAKLIFEVHDLWPLSPIELGGMSRWHPFILWTQLSENYAYRHADKVVSMLPKTKQHMIEHGMRPEKFYHIPNGIDLAEWDCESVLPVEVAEQIKEIRKKGSAVVGYAGTYGLANALDALLDAAKKLAGHTDVIFVGTGPEHARLSKRIKDEGITNLFILPAIPKSSIPAFLDAIDIAYIGLLPEPLFRFGISPNKLMDYMMSAKPIVMAISAGNDPVTDAGCGVTVEPNNSEEIANAITSIAKKSIDERNEMGENGRQYILENHTYNILANNFMKIME